MKLKISTYRPYGLLERDPAESTYEVGDDKFPVVAHINDRRIAERIVSCVNALAGIQNPAAIPDVVEALKRIAIQDCDTSETYKAGVEYMQEVARAALAKLEGGEG